jgi:CheY-like chemotaxis protein
LSNAVKFTAAGDVSVHVSASPPGTPGGSFEVRFSIDDTGIGIPDDRRHRLFQAFSQVDASTTRRYGGTGLGLAISSRLAELLGGRIGVESEVGKGSRFSFTIGATAGTLPEPWTAPALLAGRRMLIVDDHEATRQFLVRQAQAWGMDATAASSGAEALAWIAEGRTFDVALLDMHLTGTNGSALAAEIHRAAGDAAPRLIALTALGRRDTKEAQRLFATAVTKPIKASRLFDALAEMLHEPEQRRSEWVPSAAAPLLGVGHPLRILLAEDNVVNQKVALLMLKRLGYSADLVANGVEAVEAVRLRPYDVVFMDLHMPELDGLGAMREIHAAHAGGRRPRIIALTANALEEDRDACLAEGMDDYLSKPLQRDRLEAALQRAAKPLG